MISSYNNKHAVIPVKLQLFHVHSKIYKKTPVVSNIQPPLLCTFELRDTLEPFLEVFFTADGGGAVTAEE